MTMFVIKRNGEHEPIQFDKITNRIKKLCYGLDDKFIDPTTISMKVIQGIYTGITTAELDQLSAETCAYSSTYHPDFSILAARISVSRLHKETDSVFSRNIRKMYEYTHPKTGAPAPLVSKDLYDVVMEYADKLDNAIYYDRDYDFDYFGFKTLERSYLLKMFEKPVERPQSMFMRVACGIHMYKNAEGKAVLDLHEAINTYNLMSQKFFTHATPTLYNAGTNRPQLSSCFLMHMEDSIDHIFKTIKDCAHISKFAGGIGINIHDIRASKSYIRGTNGVSNGIVPMLRVLNDTARYVDQCFTPDTVILTQNGHKMIEDVSITDKVLTSNGTYAHVITPVRHDYDGTMLEIQIKNSIYPVRVTPEHQIFALQGQAKGTNFDVIRNRLSKNIAKPEFVDAKDLNKGDFLVFPIPKYVNDIETMSEDDCRFYGIMLGDGHISTPCGVSLNNTTKVATCDFVKKYLSDRSIHFNERIDGKSVNITWSPNNPRFKFTKSQLYDENGVKKLDPSFLHLPISKVKYILMGIIETDGCVGEKEIMIELSSLGLIESIRYILLRMGALASGYTRDRVGNVSSYKNITTRLPTNVIRVPRVKEVMEMFPNAPKSGFFSYLTHSDYLFSRIESIDEVNYTGTVHDFEIENPNDYVVSHLGIAHNGGGRRKGSIAIYMEPWHADIYDFLELKKNNGKEEMRARDLFYGLWISDLFMERVEANGDWTLFCPNEAPGLSDLYGDEFKNLYIKYESEGKGRQTIKAQHLWFAILQSQIETGTPYMLYKDAVNKKSNQKNLGTIRSSNLCSEILEYTSKDEIAVCNLASIALNAYVKRDGKNTIYDYTKLLEVAKTVAKNLNKVIDVNYYPVPETETSNKRHRPIGIGIQAMADTFAMMEYPFESPDAKQLNKNIFETIYYGALSASCELAEKYGPYETFQGSPASQGILQFDMWNVVPNTDANLGPVYDWSSLKERIKKFGLRNSLLLAPMPTASTAQILGNNESIEPFTSNLYTRRVLAGEFPVVNKHLMRTLVDMGLWDEKMRMQIISEKGSIQNIPTIPQKLKDLYKTVWEIKMKSLIDMAADRGAFICQTQSLNMFVAEPTYSKLTSMHFYAWKKGLKTGMYYLRTKPKAEAIQFTVDQTMIKEIKNEQSSETMEQSSEVSKEEKMRIRKEEAERKKREIREAMARGDYEHKDEVCISCSG